MTNPQPYFEFNISTRSVFDNKRTNVQKNKIIWKDFAPKGDLITIEHIDQFHYSSLVDLREMFKNTGLYTEEQLDKILESYERLPKYKAHRSSVIRGTTRGKKS